jgi:hypothetical protein
MAAKVNRKLSSGAYLDQPYNSCQTTIQRNNLVDHMRMEHGVANFPLCLMVRERAEPIIPAIPRCSPCAIVPFGFI